MFTKKETNFCKGAAISLMLFHHLFNGYEEYAGYAVSYWPFSPGRLTFLATAGKICVAMFVLLSGYGLAATYRSVFGEKRPSGTQCWQFIRARYWKLMSAYWFVFVLTLLCQPLGRTVTDAYGGSRKEMALYFLMDVLGLSDAFGTPSLNPTWWYMSVAILVIVLVPFVWQAMERFGEFPVLLLALFGVYFTVTQNNSTHYLFTMTLGIACFRLDMFGWFAKIGQGSRMRTVMKNLFVLFVFSICCYYRTDYNFCGIMDAAAVLSFMLAAHTMLARIPVLTDVLQLLGRCAAAAWPPFCQYVSCP